MGKITIFGREFISWESRSTSVSPSSIKNPIEWLLQLFGMQTNSGVVVSPETALTLPVYYAGLKIIGEDIAKISGGVFRKDGENRTPISHPVGDLIFLNPNKIINSFHWRQTMMVHALSWGNGYSHIIRDGNARPIELRLIPNPTDVEPFVIDNELWYKVTGMPQPIPSLDMFHIRGLGYDGIKGRAILAVAKEIIGGGLAAQNYSNKNFSQGALKKVALIPGAGGQKVGKVDPDVEEYIKKTWMQDMNDGRPSVLAPGLEIKEVGLNPDEVKLIETQQFTVEQYARMTRIPAYKLNDLRNAHFNNIEQQSIEYVGDTLMPWVIQFELEGRNKLFTEKEKTNHYIKFNLNSLMRGDLKSRYESYQIAVNTGFFNRNEVRSLEDANPADGLDEYFVPVNMYSPEILDIITKKMAKEIQNNQSNGSN
jgi:HK97 family phage portal protein